MKVHVPHWTLLGTMLLVLSSCGETAQRDGHAKTIEIQWLHIWGESWQRNVFEKIVSEFEATHAGVQLKLVHVPYTESAAKMRAAALAGDTSFDILPVAPEFVVSLGELGYFEALDPWLEADAEFAATLSREAPIPWKGTTRGLGLYIFPFQLLYNADLFDRRGLNPPASWEEFVEVARSLRDESRGVYGFMATLSYGEVVTSRMFGYRLAQMGGRFLDKKGNVAFYSQEGVAVLKWWKGFWDQGLLAPASLSAPWPEIMELMAAQRVATFIDGPFTSIYLKRLNPDVHLRYAPPWRDKTGGVLWNSTGITMNANSRHKEEAWEFIKFLYSEKIARLLTEEAMGAPVPTKLVMSSLKSSDNPVLRMVPALLAQDPEHNLRQPILPNMEKLVDAMKLAFQEVFLDEKAPETALEEVAKVWQREIEAARD